MNVAKLKRMVKDAPDGAILVIQTPDGIMHAVENAAPATLWDAGDTFLIKMARDQTHD